MIFTAQWVALGFISTDWSRFCFLSCGIRWHHTIFHNHMPYMQWNAWEQASMSRNMNLNRSKWDRLWLGLRRKRHLSVSFCCWGLTAIGSIFVAASFALLACRTEKHLDRATSCLHCACHCVRSFVDWSLEVSYPTVAPHDFHDMPKRLYWGLTRLRSLTYLFLRLALLLLRWWSWHCYWLPYIWWDLFLLHCILKSELAN